MFRGGSRSEVGLRAARRAFKAAKGEILAFFRRKRLQLCNEVALRQQISARLQGAVAPFLQ